MQYDIIEPFRQLSELEITILTRIYSRISDNNFVEIPKAELYAKTGHSTYTKSEQIFRSLMNNGIRISSKDGYILCNWLSSVNSVRKSDYVGIEIPMEMIDVISFLPWMRKLSDVISVGTLRGKHSKLLYSLIAQAVGAGPKSYRLEYMRHIFGNGDAGQIKRRIFKAMAKIIKACPSLSIDLTERRRGRSITEFVFTVSEVLTDQDKMKMASKLVSQWNMSEEVAIDTVNIYELSKINATMDYVRSYLSRNHVSNKTGFLLYALDNDLAQSKSMDRSLGESIDTAVEAAVKKKDEFMRAWEALSEEKRQDFIQHYTDASDTAKKLKSHARYQYTLYLIRTDWNKGALLFNNQ